MGRARWWGFPRGRWWPAGPVLPAGGLGLLVVLGFGGDPPGVDAQVEAGAGFSSLPRVGAYPRRALRDDAHAFLDVEGGFCLLVPEVEADPGGFACVFPLLCLLVEAAGRVGDGDGGDGLACLGVFDFGVASCGAVNAEGDVGHGCSLCGGVGALEFVVAVGGDVYAVRAGDDPFAFEDGEGVSGPGFDGCVSVLADDVAADEVGGFLHVVWGDAPCEVGAWLGFDWEAGHGGSLLCADVD